MALKDIIVLIDDSPGSSARLETALVMAGKFDAHLTGVLATEPEHIPDFALQRIPKSIRATLREDKDQFEEEMSLQIAQDFHKRVEKAQRTAKSDWRRIKGSPNFVAATVSRYADLVIGGQSPPSAPANRIVDPGEVVATSGRPMFLVPQDFKPKGYTAHAVLGWNGSREAGRAISDAMMILGPETQVTIATFGPETKLPESFGFDISVHLNRHGIHTQKVDLEPRGCHHSHGKPRGNKRVLIVR